MSVVKTMRDRKSTRLNSSHTVIYTLSLQTLFRSRYLHPPARVNLPGAWQAEPVHAGLGIVLHVRREDHARSEEHTSELQSHSDLHSFPTDALPISISSSTSPCKPPWRLASRASARWARYRAACPS